MYGENMLFLTDCPFLEGLKSREVPFLSVCIR